MGATYGMQVMHRVSVSVDQRQEELSEVLEFPWFGGS